MSICKRNSKISHINPFSSATRKCCVCVFSILEHLNSFKKAEFRLQKFKFQKKLHLTKSN